MTNFQVYKDEINRLFEKGQNRGGWDVGFTTKRPLQSQARCTYSVEARWVEFSFCLSNTKHLRFSEVRRLARHEYAHFIICRLDILACRRFTTEAEINEELESIARIMEKLLR